jgi:folylpolyglutamate synthase/dihydropteroate synthase
MSKVTVELDWDTVDSIVRQELGKSMDAMAQELENRREDKGMAILDMDKDKDIELMSDHLRAFVLIHDYFSAESEKKRGFLENLGL